VLVPVKLAISPVRLPSGDVGVADFGCLGALVRGVAGGFFSKSTAFCTYCHHVGGVKPLDVEETGGLLAGLDEVPERVGDVDRCPCGVRFGSL
jgi:hypothetical protein